MLRLLFDMAKDSSTSRNDQLAEFNGAHFALRKIGSATMHHDGVDFSIVESYPLIPRQDNPLFFADLRNPLFILGLFMKIVIMRLD